MSVLEITSLLATEDSMLGQIMLGAIPPLPAIGWSETTSSVTTVEPGRP